jgi:hypothetical protein
VLKRVERLDAPIRWILDYAAAGGDIMLYSVFERSVERFAV